MRVNKNKNYNSLRSFGRAEDACPFMGVNCMKIKLLITFIAVVFSGVSFACLPLGPKKEPVLAFFGPVIFNPLNTDHNVSGTAKASLSIDKSGKVTDAQIIEIKPEGIDFKPVLKAILKAKFNVERKTKDYVYIFEFGD